MTEPEVLDEIRKHIDAADSIRSLARRWEVTPSYLCDLRDGRRSPGAKILKQLGLRRAKTVAYVRVS